MSNNSKANSQGPKILRTDAAKMILKWAFLCLLIGIVVGCLVMLFFDFGVADKLFASEPTEVVAHLASNDVSAQSEDLEHINGKEIDINGLGIKFSDYTVTYDGKEHTLVATNTDKLPAGVKVEYRNNKHTNAGTYVAEAVFYGEGYKPRVLTAKMTINKANIKGVSLESIIVPYDPEKNYTVQIKGEVPEDAIVAYYPPESVCEPGIYNVTAVISCENGNYNSLTLNATITIVDLQKLVKFDQDLYTFDYDMTEHKVELDTSAVPANIRSKINFKVTYNQNKFINAGDYTVVASVSANGFETFTVETKVKINKGDLVELYGTSVEGGTYDFDNQHHGAKVNDCPNGVTYVVEYTLNGNSVTEVKDPGTYKVKFTFTDSKGNLNDKVLECEITINKIDISEYFKFNDKSYRYYEFTDEHGVTTVTERSIEVTLSEELAKLGVTMDDLKITYTYGDIESTDPLKFTDVGDYTIKATITGVDESYSARFADVVLEATLTIKYATLTDGFSVDNLTQFVIANGSYITPEYEADSDIDVEFFVNNEKVEGVKHFGIHRVKVVFTKGNYQASKTVKMIVFFNPIYVIVCAILGLLAGIGIGIIFVQRNKEREDESDKKFKRAGETIAKARGKMLCESYAKGGKNLSEEGRLYLTDRTVEFYEKSLKKTSENILIPLRGVRNVDVLKHNVIEIRANNENFVFEVPAFRAFEWKDMIVNAQTAPVMKRAESAATKEAPVVIPQVQPILQPQIIYQPQPAPETLTTVDFQVKVKTEPKLDVEVEAVSANTETCGTVETVSPAPQESIE